MKTRQDQRADTQPIINNYVISLSASLLDKHQTQETTEELTAEQLTQHLARSPKSSREIMLFSGNNRKELGDLHTDSNVNLEIPSGVGFSLLIKMSTPHI